MEIAQDALMDVLCVVASLAFFLAALGFARACDHW
jgi:hypothetical protein